MRVIKFKLDKIALEEGFLNVSHSLKWPCITSMQLFFILKSNGSLVSL